MTPLVAHPEYITMFLSYVWVIDNLYDRPKNNYSGTTEVTFFKNMQIECCQSSQKIKDYHGKETHKAANNVILGYFDMW